MNKNYYDGYTIKEPKQPESGWIFPVAVPNISEKGFLNVCDSMSRGEISFRSKYVKKMEHNLRSFFGVE